MHGSGQLSKGTKHIIHRDWRPKCRKVVEPVVTEALPKATIGNGIVVLSAWLHFALGNTISHILEVFNFHLQFQMSQGGLVQMWHRLADILLAWFEEIMEDIQKTGVLHGDWPRFCKKLKRLIRDAIRLRKRTDELDETIYQRRCKHIEKRLKLIIAHEWSNKEARRLIKRLKRHQDELFTFLSNPDVPFDNNFGERSIRGAVIMRKNSYNNRSDRGAKTQSVLMSVFFTLKQRRLNPVDTVKKALRIYLKTGKLPKLAEFTASLG